MPAIPLLSGPNQLFYQDPAYVEKTAKDLASSTPLRNSITYDPQWDITIRVKKILSWIIFPIKIAQGLHSLVGRAVLPASLPGYKKKLDQARKELLADQGEFRIKRLTICLRDGTPIDALIIGKPSTLENGRWTLFSNGNGQFYETSLPFYKRIITPLNSNALVFNYPGVGASGGSPSLSGMKEAYRSMLRYLEDPVMGMRAKEIIGFGHSIGAGVQGEALVGWTPKPGIKYAFIKNRTFYDISSLVRQLMGRIMSVLVRIFGWNIRSWASSQELKCPEVILQTALSETPVDLVKNPQLITYDGVIPAEPSLARELIRSHVVQNKTFIGSSEWHNEELDFERIAPYINEKLAR
jgi:hypothetical protein